MSISMEDVRGVLKYIQDKTGIRGYTTQQKQDAKRPYFYLETPRNKNNNLTATIIKHRVAIYGVLFCGNEEDLTEAMPCLEQHLINDNFTIQCMDSFFNPVNALIEEVELSYTKNGNDIITFSITGERFISRASAEGTPLTKIHRR